MSRPRRAVSAAMVFILLFGVVSLFSDMTGEGSASIQGAFLSVVGASAAVIGFVSGLGQLVGYSLRYVFGALADKTKAYWPLTIVGYLLDVLVIPALALVGRDGWILACGLIVVGRAGKAMKKPAKNTLVSFAATQEGIGKSFAVVEALDQIGAVLGPLLLYLVMLARTGDAFGLYSFSFAVLAIPACATIAMLLITKRKFPHPDRFEPAPDAPATFRIDRRFALYLVGSGCFAFGFIDYSIIVMHVSRQFAGVSFLTTGTLPLLYAGAMLVDAVAALAFGLLYDKRGIPALAVAAGVSAPFAVFVFGTHSVPLLLIGIALWGVGMGAQESIMQAVVSTMVPKSSRATGFGLFDGSFGVFWFLGSWLLGALYDVSIALMVTISTVVQLAAIPVYLRLWRLNARRTGSG